MSLLPPYFGYETNPVETPITFPPQHQERQPGIESLMTPRPVYDNPVYAGRDRLLNKVAIITGGDSGIGRSVAAAFAREGADMTIAYIDERERGDAHETREAVESKGRRCLIMEGDLRDEEFCYQVVEQTINTYGRLDILVNNAAVQYPQAGIMDITRAQLENTFRTNIFPLFYLTKAALPYLKNGSAIINTASVTAYEGHKELIDYASTKGAVVAFTRSLSLSLAPQGIRVNAVAPGPVWTPLIPSSFPENKVKSFGVNTPMKRAGQPYEIAPAYVFLASDDSSYVSGQVLHVNGGTATES